MAHGTAEPGAEFSRVVVVGTSGTGKTSLARSLAEITGGDHIELDALFWGPDWSEKSDEEFFEAVSAATSAPRWACDGNHGQVRDLLWKRATTIVWLDYPFPTVLWRTLSRTLRRIWKREELWAGNRESLRRSFLSRESILWWVIRTFRLRRRGYDALFHDPAWAGVHKLRVRRPRDADLLLRALRRGASAPAP